jgi:hypothetical protein
MPQFISLLIYEVTVYLYNWIHLELQILQHALRNTKGIYCFNQTAALPAYVLVTENKHRITESTKSDFCVKLY